jgi:hypothetical protein
MNRRIPVCIALAVFLLTGCMAAEKSVTKKEEAVQKGCLYGIFMSNLPVNFRSLNEFEMMSEKKAGMIMFFMKWGGDFPAEDCLKIVGYGAIPHITLEPWLGLDPIISGKEDEYIRKWAAGARDFKRPLFLRWGHEMNGNWYPWGGANNNKDPGRYIQAYRHIHDIFEKEGAGNVMWIWSPMDNSVPPESWNDAENYYPGDKYVDWLGIDGYNWGNTQSWSSWKEFTPIFSPYYTDFVSRHPGKPNMLAEFASAERGGDKVKWIEDCFTLLKKDYPQVKGLVWFNIKKECDWRLQSSQETLETFKKIISDEYYISDPQKLNSLLKGFTLPEGAVTGLTPLKTTWKKPVIDIKRTSGPVAIDGDLAEFAGSARIVMDSSGSIVSGTEAWKGKDDLSAVISIMWDDGNIYLAAEVHDDVPMVNKSPSERGWDGDGIEIALSSDSKADPSRTSFLPTDYQVVLTTGDQKDVKPLNWCWQMSRSFDQIEMAVVPAKDFKGYIIEAKIPARVFNLELKDGLEIDLDIALNDADDTGSRETQMVWSGDDLFYKEPAMWGKAVFSGK